MSESVTGGAGGQKQSNGLTIGGTFLVRGLVEVESNDGE